MPPSFLWPGGIQLRNGHSGGHRGQKLGSWGHCVPEHGARAVPERALWPEGLPGELRGWDSGPCRGSAAQVEDSWLGLERIRHRTEATQE